VVRPGRPFSQAQETGRDRSQVIPQPSSSCDLLGPCNQHFVGRYLHVLEGVASHQANRCITDKAMETYARAGENGQPIIYCTRVLSEKNLVFSTDLTLQQIKIG
jgi:hypothetical protein